MEPEFSGHVEQCLKNLEVPQLSLPIWTPPIEPIIVPKKPGIRNTFWELNKYSKKEAKQEFLNYYNPNQGVKDSKFANLINDGKNFIKDKLLNWFNNAQGKNRPGNFQIAKRSTSTRPWSCITGEYKNNNSPTFNKNGIFLNEKNIQASFNSFFCNCFYLLYHCRIHYSRRSIEQDFRRLRRMAVLGRRGISASLLFHSSALAIHKHSGLARSRYFKRWYTHKKCLSKKIRAVSYKKSKHKTRF